MDVPTRSRIDVPEDKMQLALGEATKGVPFKGIAFAGDRGVSRVEISPAAIFLLLGPRLLRRERTRLAFWFLAPAKGESKATERLTPRRNWEPVLWLIAYGAIWMWLLNPES